MSNKGFTYTLNIDAEIKDLLSKTETVKKSMQSIMDAGKAPGAEKIFKSIENALDKLQQKAAQPITSIAGFNNLQKEATAISTELGKLGDTIKNLSNLSDEEKLELIPPDLKGKIEVAKKAIASYIAVYSKTLEKTEEMIKADKELADAKKKLQEVQGKASEAKQLVDLQQKNVEAAKNEAKAIKDKQVALEKFLATQKEYEKTGADKRSSLDTNSGTINYRADKNAAAKLVPSVDLSSVQAIEQEIQKLKNEYKDASKAVTDAEANQRKYDKSLTDSNNKVTVAQASVNNLTNTVDRLNNEFEQNNAKKLQSAYTALRNEAQKLGVDISNIPIDYTEQNLIQLSDTMLILKQQGMDMANAGLDQLNTNFTEISNTIQNFKTSMKTAGTEVAQLDEKVKDATAFTQRVAQFVGLEGGIQIARRAMQNAIGTIKELDAAMTEMAVVTDLGVGDYWEQLPDYTARANELGVSIKSAYESATLYYQQGLKTNEVVAMSNETLKMARIAGLSAEDATNKMTAALRGFNMELNETSAQRVADVYSELAAITASDVKEISSAMTKTASIASSAGMEFETTAAFLSQIIETTRESAETAGTALKTVIARFQELKKDPAEIGEVDGEVVDANKIETALRSVGVALRDSSGQFRELDEVFLELSSKWADLDTNTQRYIATIAAGSRQQSRFIAMMSDYSRTQELVTAANSSAGASNEQFEKTMDSLESKLAELKNAWDSFTMGIMDSEILKTGIDLLTGILTAINNITDAFGDFSGAAKIGLLIAALYLGDKALKVFTTSIQKGSTIFGAFGKVGKTALSGIQSKLTNLNKLVQITFGKKGINVGFSKETIARSKKDLTAYTDATRKHASAKAMMNNLENKGATDTALYAKVSQRAADAEKERVAVEGNLMTALGLNEAQMAATTAMTAMGVSADKAAILAKAGISAQNLAAAVSYSGLSAAQVGAQLAAKLENASIIRVLSTKIALTVANWAQTASNTAETGTLWAKVTATIAQTMANWGLQASMWPILVVGLLIIAALAVLIGLIMAIVALVKWFNANSPEGKLKSAQEAAEAAAEAADAAAEAYNNLSDAFDSLSDKYSNLEDLTKGTQEWKEAVKDVNQEVLDLIETYPELAAFVTKDAGVLRINLESDEVQNVLRDYEVKAAEAEAASYAAKINVNEKKAIKESTDISKKNSIYVYDSKYGDYVTKGLSDATTQAMANAMQSGDLRDLDGDGDWTNELTTWLQENGSGDEVTWASSFAVALEDAVDDLQEFGQELDIMAEQDRIYREQMANAALNLVDTTKFDENEMAQMGAVASAEYAEEFNKNALKAYEDEYASADSKEEKKEIEANMKKEVAKNLYGEDATVDGNKITYKDEDGEEQTKELTDEEFKEQYAAIKATGEMTDALEKLPKVIEKVSNQLGEEAGDAFSKMYLDKTGKKMSKKDLEALSQTDLSEIWKNLGDEEKKAFGEKENFDKYIEETKKLASQRIADAEQLLIDKGLSNIELNDRISSEAIEGWANKLNNVFLTSGEEGIGKIQDSFSALTDGMSDAEIEKLMGQLNAIDWKDAGQLESLPDILKDIGLTSGYTQEELNNFIATAKETAQSVRKIDLNTLHEQMLGLQQIAHKIKTGEQNTTFSSSDYDALKAMNPALAKDFRQTLSGDFVYLGNSMDTLTEAINENTKAQLKEQGEILESKIITADVLDGMKTESKTTGIENLNTWKEQKKFETEAEKYLKNFRDSVVSKGGDLGKLGIDKLSNDTEFEKLNKKELAEILTKLSEIQGNSEANKEAYETIIRNDRVLDYQREGITTNYAAMLANGQDISNNKYNEQQYNEILDRAEAIALQATAMGVNKLAVQDFTNVINQMEELQEQREAGTISDADFIKRFNVLNQEMAKYSLPLLGKTNLNQMNTNLSKTLTSLKEFHDSIAEVADESTRLEQTAAAVDEFGIRVTENNVDTINELISKTLEGGEAGYEAFIQLLQQSKYVTDENADIIGQILSGSWSGTLEDLDENTRAFVNIMEQLGGGMWEALTEGGEAFGVAMQSVFQNVINGIDSASEAAIEYGWMHNTDEELAVAQREREQLEREYTKAENDGASDSELRKIAQQQLLALNKEAKVYQDKASFAAADMQALISNAAPELLKYITYDAKTGAIYTDDKKAKAELSPEQIEAYNTLVAGLIENRDIMRDSQNALQGIQDDTLDISDTVAELDEPDMDAISKLMNAIKDGLIKMRQDAIDALQKNTDAINEAESSLYDQISKQIEASRQERDNKKTEKDLADKQARLAYLRRDSGASAKEIAALEKEINQGQESYQDSLIDQALAELQEANDKAAEQRQEQIDLMQEQLDAYAESEEIWNDVDAVLNSSEEEIQRIAGYGLEIATQNPIDQQKTRDEIGNQIGEYKKYAFGDGGTGGAFNTALSNTTSSIVTAIGNVVTAISGIKFEASKPVVDDDDDDDDEPVKLPPKTREEIIAETFKETGDYIKFKVNAGEVINNTWMGANGQRYLAYGDKWLAEDKDGAKQGFSYDSKTGIMTIYKDSELYSTEALGGAHLDQEEIEGFEWMDFLKVIEETLGEPLFKIEQVVKDIVDKPGNIISGGGGRSNMHTYEVHSAGLTVMRGIFATGGLADFTGPAWLDGTKSHPELVLNQQDTANFIQLKDILSDILTGTSSITNNKPAGTSGDNYFDIDISVENIEDDYDVEQMAEKIKDMIYEDATYRNVNTINAIS